MSMGFYGPMGPGGYRRRGRRRGFAMGVVREEESSLGQEISLPSQLKYKF